jgi:hypothetical protein
MFEMYLVSSKGSVIFIVTFNYVKRLVFIFLSGGGKVGIVLSSEWHQPKQSGQQYEDAAALATAFRIGIIADPLFKGDYPELLKTTLASKALRLGRSSPLPEFSEQEKRDNKGNHSIVQLLPIFSTSKTIQRSVYCWVQIK